MSDCVVCGEAACYSSPARCARHKRYIYPGTCVNCGRVLYRKFRPAGGVRCAEKCLGQDVLKFLGKARTERELTDIYGEESKKILESNYPDHDLFQQRNEWGAKTFILLPKIRAGISVEEKVWKYHVGKDSAGVDDPYLLVQMPEEAWKDDKLILAPIFDVHLGHHAHRAEKFRSYLNWIREEQNVFALLGGDLLENALDDGRGMTYSQDEPPCSQLDLAIAELAPIAHKILVATPGNHEWRTYKRAGIDPMRVICDRLTVPYFSGPVLINLCAGDYSWTLYLFHGRGNSQTKGGKLNAAQRPHRFNGMLHFSISGHVHDPLVNPETVNVIDYANACLSAQTRWTVICQSFLGWKGTYAYEQGYGPPGKGGVACVVYRDGSYRATLE